MPGDWTLGLDWPTCSIDHQKCPSYFQDVIYAKRTRI